MEQRACDPRKWDQTQWFSNLWVKSPRELEKIQMLWSHLQGSWFSRCGVEPMIFVSNKCPGRMLDHTGQRPLFEGHYSSASWKNPSVTIYRGLLKPNGHWTLQPSKPSAARTHGRSWAGQTAQMPSLRIHGRQIPRVPCQVYPCVVTPSKPLSCGFPIYINGG